MKYAVILTSFIAFLGAVSANANDSSKIKVQVQHCVGPDQESIKAGKGYSLDIYKVSKGFVGYGKRICKSCYVKPSLVFFTKDESSGLTRTYSGKKASLTIHTESFAPTDTHPAVLSVLGAKGSEATVVSYSCTQVN